MANWARPTLDFQVHTYDMVGAAPYGTAQLRGFHVESAGLLYGRSAFLVALVLFVLLMAASEGGYLLGRRWQNASDGGKKDHVSVIQGAVFAMLGLLLAFSFSMAAARFENRKQSVVEESNAIGTSYLRTDLLPDPQRTATATLFREYTDARLGLARPDWYLSASSRERERVADHATGTLGARGGRRRAGPTGGDHGPLRIVPQ